MDEETPFAVLCPRCFHLMRLRGSNWVCIVGCYRPEAKEAHGITSTRPEYDHPSGPTLFNIQHAPEIEDYD